MASRRLQRAWPVVMGCGCSLALACHDSAPPPCGGLDAFWRGQAGCDTTFAAQVEAAVGTRAQYPEQERMMRGYIEQRTKCMPSPTITGPPGHPNCTPDTFKTDAFRNCDSSLTSSVQTLQASGATGQVFTSGVWAAVQGFKGCKKLTNWD